MRQHERATLRVCSYSHNTIAMSSLYAILISHQPNKGAAMVSRSPFRFWLLLVFSLWLATACGQPSGGSITPPPSTPHAELRALLETYLDADDPGVVLFVGDREESHVAAYGLADIDAGIPIRTQDYFRIGSTSKPMVSAALLTFVEAGAIALNDRIADYLPADIVRKVANADRATVRQMLQMTSGIPEYLDSDAFWEGVEATPRKFWTPAELMDFIDGEPADFAPGSDYGYSNSNYILAQIIIESLSGQPLAAVLEQTIFSPAGMDSCYLETSATFGMNIVRGYDLDDDDNLIDVTEINDGVGLGDGGVVCTVSSLVRFLPALLAGDILGAAMLDAMLESVPNSEGAPYGLGIAVQTDSEFGFGELGFMVGHDGATSGFQTVLIYLPDEALSVAALSNFVESDVLEDIVGEALEWWFE